MWKFIYIYIERERQTDRQTERQRGEVGRSKKEKNEKKTK